eukprot:5115174-Amphidinium_carterae.2
MDQNIVQTTYLDEYFTTEEPQADVVFLQGCTPSHVEAPQHVAEPVQWQKDGWLDVRPMLRLEVQPHPHAVHLQQWQEWGGGHVTCKVHVIRHLMGDPRQNDCIELEILQDKPSLMSKVGKLCCVQAQAEDPLTPLTFKLGQSGTLLQARLGPHNDWKWLGVLVGPMLINSRGSEPGFRTCVVTKFAVERL